MQLFLRILGLLDSLIKAMLLNDFLGLFLALCAMAMVAGVILKFKKMST
ncbi:MAG: hypothetical protein K2I07_00145 [Lachnospiraceae bacterium]|nr:hypothetical protein [Lachnospiraceae bacterium]